MSTISPQNFRFLKYKLKLMWFFISNVQKNSYKLQIESKNSNLIFENTIYNKKLYNVVWTKIKL
jgi:hypothetical protein